MSTEPPLPDVEIDRSSDWPDVLASVRDYWFGKRGDRSMPSRSDISPAQLKSELPHILLADVIDGGADFRYRLVGTQLRRFFFDEPSGKLMSEAIAPFGEMTLQGTLGAYRNVIERRAPVRLTGSGSFYGQDPKLFDALLAPLSDDGATVNMILGTFVFLWDTQHQFRPPADPRLAKYA
jgi:hypothetical protein